MNSKDRCYNYRKRILEISQEMKALHIAPAFSCLEITDAIYNDLMRPYDTFIMSKGHGWMAQRVILEERKILGHDEALKHHPDYGIPGIACTTGSLGHGLGMAVGMAWADRYLKADRTIYVICGDGEMAEGSIWEAMKIAADENLQISVFVDANGYAGLGQLDNSRLTEKAKAFGWHSIDIDGHNHTQIVNSISQRSLIVAHTVKGKGVPYMENVPLWHYRSPNKEEYELALNTLYMV